MAVSRKRKKAVKPEIADPKAARKKVLSALAILFLFAVLFGFIGIYSHSPLSEGDIQTVEIILQDVQEDHLGQRGPDWVLFTSTKGDTFYYDRHIHSSADAITYLRAQRGQTITIGYTSRLDLSPPFLFFLMGTNDTKRIVTAAYNGNYVYTLEEYNAYSASRLGIFVVFAAIFILIATVVIWFSRHTLFPKKKPS